MTKKDARLISAPAVSSGKGLLEGEATAPIPAGRVPGVPRLTALAIPLDQLLREVSWQVSRNWHGWDM